MLQQQAELAPFQVTTAAEAAPPISTRRPTDAPPPPSGATGATTVAGPNFEELGPGDDPLDTGGISGGNRWPRQETLALIKIRSDMDAAFRDATLKGPLWDEVSRKLGELGYKRSSKKCKEKFENVHKYYKRTKEGRVGRQDGKSYRFFDQLEALHNITMSQNPAPRAPPPAQISAPTPISTAAPTPINTAAPTPINTATPHQLPPPPSSGPELSFSTNTSSSSEYDDSDHGEDGTESGRKKRKRRMMEFFEGMLRQVMERQEAMHQRFLEAIEKREQDRMIREEAWRRQEMSRIARERELASQERAMAASRDMAIVSFLQKVTGQTIQLQPPPRPPSPQSQPQTVNEKQQQQQQQQQQQNEHPITPLPPQPPASSELVLREKSLEPQDPMSSRWPKLEVHALIQLRSRLDLRYQETGPKGLLWEEISAGMQRLGYNRSSKRCKEKWENINKYFKKVKESNKKRPEDAKTCPYFHQLDALYRSKQSNNGGGGSTISALDQAHSNLNPNPCPITMIAPSENQGKMENKSGNGGNGENIAAGGDNSGMIMKKPEDIMKELMGQSNNDYGENDSDNMDEYDEDDEEDDEEDGNGQYRIQFQKQNVDNNGGSGTTPNNGGGKVSGSFLGMVR